MKNVSIRTRFFALILFFIVLMGFSSISSMFIFKRINSELNYSVKSSQKLIDAVDTAREAQVHFKKQVQEWKNVLLRGGDPEAYNKYLEGFENEEKATQGFLISIKAIMTELGMDTASVEEALNVHKELGSSYRDALKSYDGANPDSKHVVDKLVKGIDRAPTDSIDAIVENTKVFADKSLSQTLVQSESNYRLLQIGSIVTLFVFIFGGLTIGVLFILRLTKPLITLRNKISDIAEADGDLTVSLSITDKNEIGTVAQKFNQLMEKTRITISEAAESAIKLSDDSKSLSTIVSELHSATEQIAFTSQEIAKGSQDVAAEVIFVGDELNEINKLANTTSKDMKSVIRQFDETQYAVAIGKDAVLEQNTHMSDTIKLTDEVVNAVQTLEEKTEAINTIVNTISLIADQTNLLALNAAIEAARAGEHGKGFSVVAEEVRKLAESSSKSTKEVFSNVKAIQDAVSLTISRVNMAEGKIRMQGDIVQKTESIFSEVASNVALLTERIKKIESRMLQVTEKVDSLNSSVQSISAITEETSASTQQASASIEEQTAAMDNIAMMVRDLSNMAQSLNKTVNQFKYK